MDSLIAAAARALAAGDALGALKRVALRDDPPALALRGIAMAQLGEHPRARELLRRAARGFGAHEELARARCVVAEAEVALAMRDLGGSPRALAAAAADARGARRPRQRAARAADRGAPAAAARPHRRGRRRALRATSMRAACRRRCGGGRAGRGRGGAALAAHRRGAAPRSPAPTRRPSARACRRCIAEVAEARAALDRPAARRIARRPRAAAAPRRGRGAARLGRAGASTPAGAACAPATHWLPLARRPVLFALARALAEAWPGDVERDALIARAFRTRRPDETHRARLRVEIGRLRKLAAPLARHRRRPRAASCSRRATGASVVVARAADRRRRRRRCWRCSPTAPPGRRRRSRSPSATSQRTVQRALVELEAAGRVRSIGAGARAALAGAAAGRIHDDLVTPRCAAGRVDLLCTAPHRRALQRSKTMTRSQRRPASTQARPQHRRAPPRSCASTAPSPAPTRCTASPTTASRVWAAAGAR